MKCTTRQSWQGHAEAAAAHLRGGWYVPRGSFEMHIMHRIEAGFGSWLGVLATWQRAEAGARHFRG